MSGLALAALLLVEAPAPPPPSRSSFLRTLVVAEGETVDEAVCFGCGVVVRGRVLGDTIAILGGVEVAGEAGRSAGDDVMAVGGGVRLAPAARVPASLLAVGGPVRIEPGATASYDVDALPFLHVPGQRQVFLEGAATLVGAVLLVVAVGAACVRGRGIAARDAALARSPVARGLLGAALVATVVCVMANGERLGRFEAVAQAGAGLGLLGLVVGGAPGVASLAGRGAARLAGRRLPPGLASCAVGAVVVALLALVPLAGVAAALAATCLAAGAAVAPRGTLDAPPHDEVPR